MSIETRVKCDSCFVFFAVVGSARETRVLREAARLKGWKIKETEKEDYCADCVSKGRDKKRSRAEVR